MKVKHIVLVLLLLFSICILMFVLDYQKSAYYCEGEFYKKVCSFVPSLDELGFMEHIKHEDKCLTYENVEIYRYLEWLILKTSNNAYVLLEKKVFENSLKNSLKLDVSSGSEFSSPYYLCYKGELFRSELEMVNDDVLGQMQYVGYITSKVPLSRVPEKNFETNIENLYAHVLYQWEKNLVCSWDGGEKYYIFQLEEDNS